MKKKQKKTKKNKKIKKKIKKLDRLRRAKKFVKKRKKNLKKKFKTSNKRKLRNNPKKRGFLKAKNVQKESLVLKLVKLQLSLKPQFNFKFNFSLEKYIQGFFDKISETISNYKIIKDDEKRKLKIEKIETERKEKILVEK